jgi:hypothetical protein
MSYVTQPIALNYKTKNEQTVAATRLATSQNLGPLSGPIQARLVNYDTVRVAFLAGPKADADAITLAGAPTIAPGATEVFTIMPNSDGSAVYWNIISDASPAGNKFEVTLGVGY